jgi:hypothetical protein
MSKLQFPQLPQFDGLFTRLGQQRDDEPDRKRDGSSRAKDPPCYELADERSEAALGVFHNSQSCGSLGLMIENCTFLI